MEILISGAEKLGLQLDSKQLDLFEIYYRELVDWNRRMNLTAITDYERVQINHFLDALTVIMGWQPVTNNAYPQVIDVGTGAGIPGLPLKIMFPDIKLVLLEATARKADFLHHLKDRLALDDVEVVVGRAEEVAHLQQYRERFDLVLSRAVARLATLVELTLPFCRIDGMFIAHKKGDIDLETTQAQQAIGTLGGNLRQVKSVNLEVFTDQRWLVIIDKVKPTPDRYPRRSGMPEKRPLV